MGREPAPVRARDDRAKLPHDRCERAQAARALSGLPHDHQQHRCSHGGGLRAQRDRRRPLSLHGGVPDTMPSEADPGLGHLRRRLPRPAAGAPLRAGHGAAVAAALHREPGAGRRLLVQLPLRVHGRDQLGFPDRAAADDPRPTRRVRSALRRRRKQRGAGGAQAHQPEHPRLDRDGSGDAPGPGRNRGPQPAGPVPRERARGGAPHSEGGGVQHHRRGARTARAPPASPTRSPSTWS